MSLLRLAVVFDYPEEGWASMDLVAEMLFHHLSADHRSAVRATRLRPKFHPQATFLPMIRNLKGARNIDRFLNRYWYYPRYLLRHASAFDFFHISDHSYSHLVLELPNERTGVFCHDLDAFRCILEPRLEPRPRWFRRMTKGILHGLQKAAIVFYSTRQVRQQIEKYGLIDPNKLIHAPYGIAAEYTSEPNVQESEVAFVAGWDRRPYLLHVGSCIPRKRIDVLLEVFAQVRTRHPDFLLVQLGGIWTEDQRQLIDRLQIAKAVHQIRGLDRKTVAALYRQARLVLQPSEAEGFGLPVVEALACGAVVVASDIPVLREVGGEAVVYCPVADVPAWTATACRLLEDTASAPELDHRLSHARRYSWPDHTQTILTAYQKRIR